jgi:serine/threonine-protein phosphatase 6 regulatory ankyrin repeat subunit B
MAQEQIPKPRILHDSRQSLESYKSLAEQRRQGELDADLLSAAFHGDNEKIEKLLREGANMEATDSDDRTALTVAARWGRTETCELLIKYGANMGATDNDDRTVLMAAAVNGETETCALLIEKGADVNAKDWCGATALMWAAWKGNTKTCALLLARGASLHARGRHAERDDSNSGGMTAVGWAESENRDETSAFLKSIGLMGKKRYSLFLSPFMDCIV